MTSTNSLTTKCDAAASSVLAWLLEGQTESDILEAIATNHPNVPPQKVISAVVERLKQSAHPDKDALLGWCIEAYRDIYRREMEIGDYANAVKIVKELYRIANAVS